VRSDGAGVSVTSGGRQRGIWVVIRRIRIDLALAGGLPVVCAVALLLADPSPGDSADPTARTPMSVPLTSATLVCPASVGAQDEVTLASAAQVAGEVSVRRGDTVASIRVTPGAPSAVALAAAAAGSGSEDAAPVVVLGADTMAPGLIGVRDSRDPLTAAACLLPSGEQWFAGLGSGATHNSIIDLVNPTEGPAVADITLLTQAGPIQVPELLGVAVPGGTRRSLDLGAIAPRRGELTAHVRVSRGRLAVSVADTVDALADGVTAADWVAPQSAPAERVVILGLARGAGDRTLVIGNPSPDELTATLKFITPRSSFAPLGVDEITLPPESTRLVRLGPELADATAQGAFGLDLEATGPILATLRQEVADDVSSATAAEVVTARTSALVPPGTVRLLLADAERAGSVVVTAVDADGAELTEETVEIVPGAGANLALPAGTVLVRLEPRGTTLRAAVLGYDRRAGTAVLPLRDLVLNDLLPDVRPGLP
jgi:hypothetical protein